MILLFRVSQEGEISSSSFAEAKDEIFLQDIEMVEGWGWASKQIRPDQNPVFNCGDVT